MYCNYDGDEVHDVVVIENLGATGNIENHTMYIYTFRKYQCFSLLKLFFTFFISLIEGKIKTT